MEYLVDNVAEKVGEKVAGDAFRNMSKKLFKNMSRKRFENVSKKVIRKNLVENMAEILAKFITKTRPKNFEVNGRQDGYKSWSHHQLFI